jgi:hypothetical protein
MSKAGRLEGRITFAANKSWTFTDSAGSGTATLLAGSYYPTELAAAVQASIIAVTGSIGLGATVTLSRGEGTSATGRVTITTTQTPYAIDWGAATDVRDALGFTGNIASTSSASTGTNAAKAIWLPQVAKFSRYGDGANGETYTDATQTVTKTGVVTTLYGSKHRRHEGIQWTGVAGRRVMAHQETVTNESFESFFLDCMTGRVSYIPVGTYVRLIWDADVDGTYAVGRLLWPSRFSIEQLQAGWNGRYTVPLPPLVVES